MKVSIHPRNSLDLLLEGPYNLLVEIKNYFTHKVPGSEFSWQYKSGRWDGRISLFDRNLKSLPYGLLFELIEFKKSYYPKDKWDIDEKVKSLFKGPSLPLKWDLKFEPRDYQQESIKTALKFSKGILRLATSAGKSLVITYIWKHLYDNGLTNKAFIVVPNLNLITQFHNDLVSYGVDESLIGEVWAKEKQWDKAIIVSTWQSLSRYPKQCETIDAVFWDECVALDSKISSPNGQIEIKDLKIGDKVFSYNEELSCIEEDEIVDIYENISLAPMYEIVLENNEVLRITANHKVKTTRGWIRVDNLNLEDELLAFK